MTKRAAIYARVSTDDQAEHGYSLQSQITQCRQYAAANGMDVAQVYEDGGVSGELPMDARPAGLDLLEALRRREAEAVIVYTADRLSRNAGHFLALRDQWQKRGIELHYVDRGKLANTPEGRLMQTIESGIAEFEREKIRMRTMGGKRDKVRAGHWLGIHTPYGYRREGKGREARIFIDESEAEIVRRIFQWYTVGDPADGAGPLSLLEIVRRLAAAGVQTTTGQPEWERATIRKILSNEIYAGYQYYGKTRLGPKEYDSQKTWERAAPVAREEWVRVELPTLAIVTQAVFDAALARAKRNQDMANRKRADYLLSGFLTCGHCGHAMGGTKHTKHKADGAEYVQFFYRCPNTKCAAKTKIQAVGALDSVVWGWLYTATKDRPRVLASLRGLAEAREGELIHKRERLASMADLIAEREDAIRELVAEFARERNEKVRAALRAQRQTETRELERLTTERGKLENEISRREVTAAQQVEIMAMLAAIGRRMAGAPTVAQRRGVLEALEVKVTFSRLDAKRPVVLDWSLGPATTLYLGDDCPRVPNADWVDLAVSFRATLSLADDNGPSLAAQLFAQAGAPVAGSH